MSLLLDETFQQKGVYLFLMNRFNICGTQLYETKIELLRGAACDEVVSLRSIMKYHTGHIRWSDTMGRLFGKIVSIP